MLGDSRESNHELDSCVGEDTHLGEERVCDVDVAEVDGGENLGALGRKRKDVSRLVLEGAAGVRARGARRSPIRAEGWKI